MTGQSNVVGGGPSVLRELNLRHVLTVIRRDGPLSRADLRRLTGLSRPTINEVVADLLARAWIADEHASEETWTGPGPRPRLLRFRAEMGAVVGVDVGAAKTLVVIADLDGEVRSKVRVPTHGITPSRRLVDHTVKTVIRALSDAGTDASGVHCAVLSTPGVVDPVTGVVTLAPQLGDWGGLPPAVQLSDRLGCPVTVENEMALAVLGEHWSGAAQGVENVIYVGLGVGVGAGALIEGKLYRGPHGIAGEIGYLPLRRIEPDGAQTEPGQFEQAVGARGLITRGQSVAGTPEAGAYSNWPVGIRQPSMSERSSGPPWKVTALL